MTAAANDRFFIENNLRRAISNGEFELYYQPQLTIGNQDNFSVEALLRWNHSTLGMLPPLKFIPIAEETGIIVDIGSWVIKTAFEQLKKWNDAGLRINTMAINISLAQVHNGGLISCLKMNQMVTGINSTQIELEVTESVLSKNIEKAKSILGQAKKLGYTLSIDDFGTGYSSLNQLKKMPLHKLKIDKSFVDDVPGDVDDETIIEAIIGLAKNLGQKVTPEGVETKKQERYLVGKGCTKVQGYLYSKPLPVKELEIWVSENVSVIKK